MSLLPSVLILCAIALVLHVVSSTNSTRRLSSQGKYSSFRCIGGSQVLDANSMKQASVTVFPLNDAAHRTCLFSNICAENGKLTFYSKYGSDKVAADYLPEGFDGNIFHVAYLRAFTLPVQSKVGSIPTSHPFSPTDLTFLDANSWSFNYGHYLIDNTIPNFMAAKIFNLPFEGTQQLFETNCRLFSILEPAFADRIVTYNRSMGSYRQACLAKLDGMYAHFYDKKPQYLDDMQSSTMCYKKLMVGQGSTFGLKSIDLSRGYFLREFRDFVLKRMIARSPHLTLPPQEDLVLVGLRTVGAAGGKVINELCDATTAALKENSEFNTRFKVECFVPSDLSFEEEIRQVQRAKVIVSVHGTISYMSLFSRDGTQQISIANPKELKENQILLYATHFHTLYLTWDKMQRLSVFSFSFPSPSVTYTPDETLPTIIFASREMIVMSFGYRLFDSFHDSMSLRVADDIVPSSCTYLASNPSTGEFIVDVELNVPQLHEESKRTSYEVDGDFEQMSTSLISRYLLKCSDQSPFPIPLTNMVSINDTGRSVLGGLKSKVGIALKPSLGSSDFSTSAEESSHFALLFGFFHRLLESGYHSFATDDQLHGVAAKRVNATSLEVCAIKNLVADGEGRAQLTLQLLNYKCTPLAVADVAEAQPEGSFHWNLSAAAASAPDSYPAWSVLRAPVTCTFLPTNEVVQLLALIPYIPLRSGAQLSPHRTFEQAVFLTPQDCANRARGYNTYLPDSYARARLYWELAYGVLLPKVPALQGDGAVVFARTRTALSDQFVPFTALCRGTAEYPWKSQELARAAAERAVACLHGTNWVHKLGAPVTAAELQQKLRSVYEPRAQAPGTGGGHVRPLLVSALRMKRVQDGEVPLSAGRVSTSTTVGRTATPTSRLQPPAREPEDSDLSQDLSLSDASSVDIPAPRHPAPTPAVATIRQVAIAAGTLQRKQPPIPAVSAASAAKQGGKAPSVPLKRAPPVAAPAKPVISTIPAKGNKAAPAKRAKKA